MFFNNATVIKSTIDILPAFGNFVPSLVILMEEQLHVNKMWQSGLKLGTIRPGSQRKQCAG